MRRRRSAVTPRTWSSLHRPLEHRRDLPQRHRPLAADRTRRHPSRPCRGRPATGRDWLCNAGLALDAQLADGRSLFRPCSACCRRARRHWPAGRPWHRSAASPWSPACWRRCRRTAVRTAPACRRSGRTAPTSADAWPAIPTRSIAAALSETGLVATLLARGTDANRDARGRMPLHFAMKARGMAAVDITRALIRHGADPDRAAAGETGGLAAR